MASAGLARAKFRGHLDRHRGDQRREIGRALDELIALLQALRRDLPHGERLAEVFGAAARWRERIAK